jgi:hypothetical protein
MELEDWKDRFELRGDNELTAHRLRVLASGYIKLVEDLHRSMSEGPDREETLKRLLDSWLWAKQAVRLGPPPLRRASWNQPE